MLCFASTYKDKPSNHSIPYKAEEITVSSSFSSAKAKSNVQFSANANANGPNQNQIQNPNVSSPPGGPLVDNKQNPIPIVVIVSSSSSSPSHSTSPPTTMTMTSATHSHIVTMTSGDVFTRIDGFVTTTTSSIWMFYRREIGGKLGAICHCPLEHKEKITLNHDILDDPMITVLPVHLIKFIHHGSQTMELKSSLDHFPSTRSFGFTFKDRSAIRVVCASKAMRNIWLQGTRSILREQENVMKGVENKVSLSSASSSSSSCPSSSNDSLTPLLDEGILLQMFSFIPSPSLLSSSSSSSNSTLAPRIQSQSVFLWYEKNDQKFGTLYWAVQQEGQKSKTKISPALLEHFVPIHRIQKVFIGKQTDVLKSEMAKNIPSSQCLSLLSSSTSQIHYPTLHLVAESQRIRNQFLKELKGILKSMQKNVEETKRKTPNDPVYPHTYRDTSIREAETVAVLPLPILLSPLLLEKGDYFTAYFGVNPTIKKTIFVFYEPSDDSLGTLFYTESAGDKTLKSPHSIPLKSVSDVFLGKQTAELTSDLTANISSSLCFSIVTNRNIAFHLHLHASHAYIRTRWVDTLKSIFARKYAGQYNDKEMIYSMSPPNSAKNIRFPYPRDDDMEFMTKGITCITLSNKKEKGNGKFELHYDYDSGNDRGNLKNSKNNEETITAGMMTRKTCFVWLDRTKSLSGTICWAFGEEEGEGEESWDINPLSKEREKAKCMETSQMFDITQISSTLLGKECEVFECHETKEYPEVRCATILYHHNNDHSNSISIPSDSSSPQSSARSDHHDSVSSFSLPLVFDDSTTRTRWLRVMEQLFLYAGGNVKKGKKQIKNNTK